MSVSRRALLGTGALALGTAALGAPLVTSAAAATSRASGSLAPDALRKLPA
ncbi:hypothetical protein GTW93_21270, partial [Streptomyces sp. SID5789]|nr:hypothetical protein [Streptomyces sp. SID5789]